MKVNGNLEIVSQIVVNDLDTFDKHHQRLALDSLIKDSRRLFIIDGNGGEGKTTFAFRLAAGLGNDGYLVFFMDLMQQSNTLTRRDVENLISEMGSESNSEAKRSFLFIDNPCANLDVLGWIHDAVEYCFSTINIILVERASRLGLLFNKNANRFPEWEEGVFRIRLRNTAKKWDDQAEHAGELWINRSFAMRKNILEKMLGTIEGIDMRIVNRIFRIYLNDLMQGKNMTVVEAMFYLKFKYNEMLQERNLPISKRIPLDWDEWDDLIRKNSISPHFCYGYIAAPYLFSYQFPVYSITQERPDFLSVLNTINQNENVEPLIFDKGKGRLYPKHEAIAEMYFRFYNINNITEFLTANFHKFSTAMQKSFILRVMRKQFIQENAIGSFNVEFGRVLDVVAAEKISVEMADQVALIRYWISCTGDQPNCEEIKELTKQYPNNQDIWKEYISVCILSNDYNECERAMKNLFLIDGKSYWTLRFIAETYYVMSNVEQAVKYYYAASKKSENRLRDYRRIEKILEETQTNHGLAKVRQRIIEMEYKNFSNYIRLDRALMADGETDSCFKNYEYAQCYFPENTWGYEKLIELAFQNGYYGKANKNIRKYYIHFGVKTRTTQAKLLQYWTLLCWSDNCYVEEVRQLVSKNCKKITEIWEEEINPSVLRWILVLCLETGLEQILPLTNINHVACKDEMTTLLSTINPKAAKPIATGAKILWPKKFLDGVFNESKVYFRGQARFWHSFIRFVYHLFERLRDACHLDPYQEKTLYWNMKPQMQKWTAYAMQRFLARDQSGLDEILSCMVEYEIILFLTPFHWYEKYFEGQSEKAKKLEQIVAEKQKVIFNIQKVYTESAKILLADGQVKEANQLLAEIVKRYPKHIPYLNLYITSLIELNDSKAVYQWYLYVLSQPKSSIPNRLFTNTVNYYMGLNDWETIETIIQASEGIISDRKKIKICEMQLYLQKGDFDAAEGLALDIQKEGKLAIESILTLYQIYCKRKDMQKAREMAYDGVKRFPNSINACINLADYLYKTGKKEEALQICLKRINNGNPIILKLGKELCCECGQYKNAVAFYYRYCKLMRKNKNLERLSYADIAEGMLAQGKIGPLKRFLKNVRRRYGYEKTVQEYMSKIMNQSPNVIT